MLNRIAEGDEQAFRTVYEQYAGQMYHNALRFTKHPEWARDLTQEIFFRIWTSRRKLREVERFDAYLYVVARNCIFNELKKQLPLSGSNEFLEAYLQYDHAAVHDSVEAKDLESRLMAAIAGLPQQMQTVFRLSRFEGLTHDQIAERMNISPTTSKSYIVRALLSIRKQLAQQGDTLLCLSWLLFQAR
ncbi:MAG: RNA polymerase sigma-70 factor [Candidatus Pseudobacter hemicellulosilyticus]|uniref:RNA polymerase sigma-70 factor n=1 Tax=Candidatus Pseudobacter hemicellulosilyticus TaxID=3121375 RepID=A0AAJ5WPG1_9BACT|nr:MAG: RNA polymerase sigma-70 factor [Pseudobacter sp.]